MLDLVSRWAKKGKGGNYRIEALEQLGIGREASSLQLYLSIVGKKILPFIRHHCFGDNENFKVTDLIAFGSERWKRLTEQMVIECHREVGHSPALKKAKTKPAAAAGPKSKAKKTKALTPSSTAMKEKEGLNHPKYEKMIITAITELKSR